MRLVAQISGRKIQFVSTAILSLWLCMALVGPLLPLTPNLIELDRILHGADSGAWLGYDDLGRPLFDRLMVGARTSFLVSTSVVGISLCIGVAMGLIAGFFGGVIDRLISYVVDVFLAFPGILLAIALAGMMGPAISNVVVALSIVSWVGFARLTRAQVFSIKQRDHVAAARALGLGRMRILYRHILPLIMAPLIVEASFGIASVVIAEAGLSFLGLGVQAPEASWGNMIRDGARYLLIAPHIVLVPGVTLAFVVISVNLLGDNLRDRWDVRDDRRVNNA